MYYAHAFYTFEPKNIHELLSAGICKKTNIYILVYEFCLYLIGSN